SNPDVIVSFMTSPARSKAILEENARLHVVDKFFDPSANCGAINAGATSVAIAANTNTGAVLNGDAASDLAKKYVTNYYGKGYSPNPDPNIANALYAYDNIGWLKQAMEKSGSIDDVDKILPAMNSITYSGINGDISMKDNQQTYGQVVCYSANGGPP